MKKTNIFGLVLILSTLLIGCAQPNMCADIPEVYTITCGNNVTANKTQAMAGEMITVTASRDGYRTIEIKVDGERVSETSSATFTMPSKNVDVDATFVQLYTISAVVPDGITVNKTSAVAGEEVTVTLGGDFQSIITGVIVKKGTDPIDVNTNNTFNMPEGNVEITVGLPIEGSENAIAISYIVEGTPLNPYEGLGLSNYDTYNDLSKSSIYVVATGGYYLSEASIPSDTDYIEYVPDTITMTWDGNNLPQINVSCIEKIIR